MTDAERPEGTVAPLGPLAQVLRALGEKAGTEEDRKYSTFRALVSASLLGELRRPSRGLLLDVLRDLDPMVEDWARMRVTAAAPEARARLALSEGTAFGLAWRALRRLLENRYGGLLEEPERIRDVQIVEQVFGVDTAIAILRPRPWLAVYESLLEKNNAEALMEAAWRLDVRAQGTL